MKKILYLFLFLIIISNTNSVEIKKAYSPVEISEVVFGENGFSSDTILPFCCTLHLQNFRDTSLGQMLPKGTKRSYISLYQDDSTAITRVALKISDEDVQDFYVYFVKLDEWHIETIRTLTLTEVIRGSLADMKELPKDSAMALIKSKGFDDMDKYISRLKLIISSDEDIENYFQSNFKQFDKIAGYIKKNDFINKENGILGANKDPEVMEMMKDLLLEKIVAAESGEFVAGFLIGGILDNSVGYFYQPDATKIPKMSKDLYIMIKKLAPGWYMYKTT